MKQLLVRYARPEDKEQWLEWSRANKYGDFDPDIVDYPTLQVLCSYDKDRVAGYIPVQRAVVMESYASNPDGVSPGSIRDLLKATELLADGHGIREIYFIGGEGGMGELAERYGFEKLAVPVYRMKLA